jgi:hypothetical protein
MSSLRPATAASAPASSPRQALVARLAQTIAAAHPAGDIATAQIAARTLAELLSTAQPVQNVAPVVDIGIARRARA